MGILDYYLQPKLLEIESNKDKVREEHLIILKKGKTHVKRKNCIHEYKYKKWVYKSKKEGIKDSFHYKGTCSICGYKHCLPRTKKLFELLKNDKWYININNK